MTLRIVSNSTPLIALAKISRFHLLKDLFHEIIIPKAVYEEVVTSGKGRSGHDELINADWIQCHQVHNHDLVTFLRISLDAGESEAIALARETGADLLLIDDGDGRRVAESVNIAITGTIGLLLRYYRDNPKDFRDALDDLQAQGFRLNRKEYARVLKQAEEGIR